MAAMPGSKQAGQANLLQGFVSSTNPQHQRSDEYRLDPNVDLNLGLDEPKRPWRKVALAVSLLVIGAVLLFTGVGLYFTSDPNLHGTPLIIVGSITFLPGVYYSRIAYMAWRGYRGYDLSLIPDF